MAVSKKSLANLKPPKKGEIRNPLGGKAHNPELRMVKRLTAIEVAEIGSLVLKNDIAALKAIAKEQTASTLKVMIAAVAVKVIEKGDAHALDVLLNRLIGKVKEHVEVTGVLGLAPMTSEERTKELIRLRKLRELTESTKVESDLKEIEQDNEPGSDN